MLYKTIMVVLFIVAFCGCAMESDPSDLEDWFAHQDRTVYHELTTDDIVDIVDSVMRETDSDWPGGEGRLSCYVRLGMFDVYFVDDMLEFCDNCLGKIYLLDWKIYITTQQSLLDQYETLGHEYIHFVGSCFYSDSDSDHERADFWATIDPENSLEAKVNEEIWQATREGAL